MKTATAAEMRALDQRTIAQENISGEVLMERAGRAVARRVLDVLRLREVSLPRVVLAAGVGNNGGDAFVAARLLAAAGVQAEVWLAGAADRLKGEALASYQRLASTAVRIREMPTAELWLAASGDSDPVDVLVDGLLGTGQSGAPREPVAAAIRCLNSLSVRAPLLAIDLPSGLDADTGAAAGELVRADITVTLGLPKAGMVQPAALEGLGSLDIADIGLADAGVQALTGGPVQVISSADLRATFSRRPHAAHKGMFGHVLLIGGARGYSGAIALAARAAVRSGAGLVSVVTTEQIAQVVAAACPECMVAGMPATEDGALTFEWWEKWSKLLAGIDAVLIGPGLTQQPECSTLVRRVIKDCPVPMVFDADALNILAGHPDWFRKVAAPFVLTPHPGEMARLLDSTVGEIQADRLAAARQAAREFGATVVLKGAGTLVVSQASEPWINLNGNPGMACGGSGDVLAGLLAGLLAQGIAPDQAAHAGVYLHGRAGDRAALRQTQAAMTAGDILSELPAAFRELSAR